MQSVKRSPKSPKKRTKIRKVADRKKKTGETVSSAKLSKEISAEILAEAPISEDEVRKFHEAKISEDEIRKYDDHQLRKFSPTIQQVRVFFGFRVQ